MADKLIRVSEETHRKLTDLGRKGDTYEEIIERLLDQSKHSMEISALCSGIKKILDSRGMYPAKSPFRTPAFQAMVHDIYERVSKIETLSKTEEEK